MKRTIVALGMLLALFTWEACAATAIVAQYAGMGTAAGGATAQISQEPAFSETNVDYSAGVASSAAFASTTRYIYLQCDSKCSYRVRPGCTGSSAATTNKYLLADGFIYLGVNVGKGDCISIITKP